MTRLASDADLRRSMGQAGRRRYEANFTAEATARELLNGILQKAPSAGLDQTLR